MVRKRGTADAAPIMQQIPLIIFYTKTIFTQLLRNNLGGDPRGMCVIKKLPHRVRVHELENGKHGQMALQVCKES
ncbi:hypothetical protein M404DRAFT_996135 [Pisolithus tinctorius Marx 270]|uniref:Uncharacterized protein n=1 Tax=Pisolithus tinctorius Marx 270 TaxID=870435 RepID=A0A0C3PP23_PISTI|nr:hypothetical protein M404DRAFT_996135 [Pisolithus tinctorius Marx 270]